MLRDARVIEGPGFVGVDGATDQDDAAIGRYVRAVPAGAPARSRKSTPTPGRRSSSAIPPRPRPSSPRVAGDKYSYRELDDYTELISRTLKTLPIVSKVTRSGLLDERVFLEYSQERLASYGVTPGQLQRRARQPQHHHARRHPRSRQQEPDDRPVRRVQERAADRRRARPDRQRPLRLPARSRGRRARLRQPADVPQLLRRQRSATAQWRRSRGITIAVQMRAAQQIAEFGKDVDAALDAPEDASCPRT